MQITANICLLHSPPHTAGTAVQSQQAGPTLPPLPPETFKQAAPVQTKPTLGSHRTSLNSVDGSQAAQLGEGGPYPLLSPLLPAGTCLDTGIVGRQQAGQSSSASGEYKLPSCLGCSRDQRVTCKSPHQAAGRVGKGPGPESEGLLGWSGLPHLLLLPRRPQARQVGLTEQAPIDVHMLTPGPWDC